MSCFKVVSCPAALHAQHGVRLWQLQLEWSRLPPHPGFGPGHRSPASIHEWVMQKQVHAWTDLRHFACQQEAAGGNGTSMPLIFPADLVHTASPGMVRAGGLVRVLTSDV